MPQVFLEKNVEFFLLLQDVPCSRCKKIMLQGTGCLEEITYSSGEVMDFFRNRRVTCFQCFKKNGEVTKA